MDLMDAIDVLTSEDLETMMDAATREKIREFVLAGREAAAPATGLAPSPSVAEVPAAVASAPEESDSEANLGQGKNYGIA
jgi:hypothetical protein